MIEEDNPQDLRLTSHAKPSTGLYCLKCGKTVSPNTRFSLCPEHDAERRKEKQLQQNHLLIAVKIMRGECYTCSKKAVPGKRLCEEHLENLNTRAKKIMAQKRKEGLCYILNCYNKPTEGKICDACKKKKRDEKIDKIIAGICTWAGGCTKKANPGKRMCEEHRIKTNEMWARKHNKQKMDIKPEFTLA